MKRNWIMAKVPWCGWHLSERNGALAFVLMTTVISAATFLLLFYVAPGQIVLATTIQQNQVQPAPSLTLTYTSNVTVTTFDGLVNYQITIHNTDPVTAHDLTFITMLPLPGETTYVPGTLTASGGYAGYDWEEHRIHWAGAVSARGSVLITFAVQLTKFMTCRTLYSYTMLQAPTLSETLSAIAKVEYRCPEIQKLQFTMNANLAETTPGSVIDYQLAITNSSDIPASALQIINPIPFGAAYVTGSAAATSGTITYSSIFKELTWDATLAKHSTAQLSFRIQVRERIRCGAIINNQATIYNTGFMLPSHPTIQALTIVSCTESQSWSDFGDAPDSDSNHHSMSNTAYAETGVLGHFPTVWEGTPTDEASGPTHHIGYFWLGDGITAEVDADLNFNPQSIAFGYDFTNILHNGKEDVADQDDDEGWYNRNVPMLNCETSTLLVRVRRSNLPTTIERLWLNVWFDGNRDGDWQDSGDCPNNADPLSGNSFEWVVQDRAINPDQVPPSGFLDLQIPTKLIYNPSPTLPVWLRFTLSEQPALRPTFNSLADGRGPAYPALFQVGETEDYRMDGLPQGEPISINLQHYIGDGMGETVYLGEKIDFDLSLKPAQGVTPATIIMTHTLPAEITLVDQPEFYVFHTPEYNYLGPDNGVTPLAVTFQPDKGPNGRIAWRGQLIQGTEIFITYEAKVNICPPPNESGQPMLRSLAQVRQPDGTVATAEATYLVDCTLMNEESTQLFLPLVNK